MSSSASKSAQGPPIEPPIVPIAASNPRKPCKWKVVQVMNDVISLKGGFNTSPFSVKCVLYKQGLVINTFVEMNKNAPWFLRGVAGIAVRKGDLAAVSVLKDIRAKYFAKDVAANPLLAAVAGGGTAAVAAGSADTAVDPMDALDEVVEKITPPKGKKTREPKTNESRKSEVRELQMPMRPLCSSTADAQSKTIFVYRKPGVAQTTLWLRHDCLNWLLSYAADQLHFQDIPRPQAPPQSRVGNCSEVPDVHLQYDFTHYAWDAEFLAGEFAGTKLRFFMSHLNKDRWSKLIFASSILLRDATAVQQMNGGRELVTRWCHAIVTNDRESFEQEWGLVDSSLETPVKTKKRRTRKEQSSDEEDAAVAEMCGEPADDAVSDAD